MHPSSVRWGPVLLVMVAAPWFAELSWGGYPLVYLPVAVLFVGPMYGGAVLLIREFTVRTGRGWPSIVLLAAAFGVLQAGLVDQSLFNPAYGRFDFQHPAHLPGIDVSAFYVIAFVSGHVVASIAAPLVVAETWSSHPHDPWLSRRGVHVVAALYVVTTVINFFGVKDEDGNGFQASALQSAAAGVVVLILVMGALSWRTLPATRTAVPPRWALAAISFVAYLLYLPVESAVGVVIALVVITTTVVALVTWSRSREWSADHTFAVLIGTILTGAVAPFLTAPYDAAVSPGADRAADIGAAAVCLVIVAASIWRRTRK